MMDCDGLVTHPHKHNTGQPITEYHRHERGKVCANVRNEISEYIASHLNLGGKPKWNPRVLHTVVTYTCVRGQIGKRRAFYKTVVGIAIKNEYKEKESQEDDSEPIG